MSGQFGVQGEPIRIADTEESQHESRVQPPVTLATGAEAPLPITESSIPPLRPAGAAPLPGDASTTREERGLDKPEPHDASNTPPPPTAEAVAAATDARLRAAAALVTKWSDTAETTPIRGDRNRGQREATLACADELKRTLGI